MSKLVKVDTAISPASKFASKIEKAIAGDKIALTRPLLTNCPACGSASMNDPQAQFVGACSSRCAKQLGISEEVLRASGSMPPALLPTAVKGERFMEFARRVGSPPVSVLATAIAPRVDRFTEYADMMKVIDRQLFDRFVEPMPERAVKAANNAFELGVPASAETTVSTCGCIWALQTTFTSGSGDIVLDLCSTHARSRT